MTAAQIEIRNTVAKFIEEHKLDEAVRWLAERHPHSYFTVLKKPYCSAILEHVVECTRFLPEDADVGTRAWHLLNGKTQQETCATCGKAISKLSPLDSRAKHFCSNRCAQKDP